MNLLFNHHFSVFLLLNVSAHICHPKLITVYLSKKSIVVHCKLKVQSARALSMMIQ